LGRGGGAALGRRRAGGGLLSRRRRLGCGGGVALGLPRNRRLRWWHGCLRRWRDLRCQDVAIAADVADDVSFADDRAVDFEGDMLRLEAGVGRLAADGFHKGLRELSDAF